MDTDSPPPPARPALPCAEVGAPGFGWGDAVAGGPPTSALAAALEALSEKLSNGAAACRLEFRQLEELQSRLAAQESFAAARRAPNSNRYSDVMPYDSNRVRITGPAPAPTRFGAAHARGSDYINASPLANPQPGAAVPWRYIAAQGPLARTCPAFWQMIVQGGVRLVVMLTRVTERGDAKCAPYFGERAGSAVRWGGTKVATQEVEELMPHLFRRRLSVAPPGAPGGPHHVEQLQYTGELSVAAGTTRHVRLGRASEQPLPALRASPRVLDAPPQEYYPWEYYPWEYYPWERAAPHIPSPRPRPLRTRPAQTGPTTASPPTPARGSRCARCCAPRPPTSRPRSWCTAPPASGAPACCASWTWPSAS